MNDCPAAGLEITPDTRSMVGGYLALVRGSEAKLLSTHVDVRHARELCEWWNLDDSYAQLHPWRVYRVTVEEVGEP